MLSLKISSFTYNPGRNLASRSTEHGMIRMGLVGKDTKAAAGDEEDAAGLAAASGGLTEPLLTTFDLGVVVAELVF